MKTPTRWAIAAIAGMLVVLTGAARAQDDSLKIIPAKSPIVVQINGIDKARGNLGKFLGNALPDIAPKLVKKIDEAITEISKDRDLKTISKDGRIYVAVTDLTDLIEKPQIAVLVPATSYKNFKDGFLKEAERKSLKDEGDGVESANFEGTEEPAYLTSLKEYVVIAHDKEVAKTFVKHDTTKGLDSALSKQTAKAFLGQDVAVYINMKEINKEYGAKIRLFKGVIEPLLQGGGGMGLDKKQIEAAKHLINGVISLLDDGAAVVLGFEFRPEGANIHFLSQFTSDSETNDFLKKLKPAPLKEIGSLPSGLLIYSASNFDPSGSKTLSALAQLGLADDENEDVREIIKKKLKELAENGRVVQIAALNDMRGGLELSEYRDGAKALASELSLFKALTKAGSIGELPFKEKPEIAENVETVGGYKLSSVKLSFDLDKAVEKLPEDAREAAKAAMAKMAGEASTIWLGNSGNKVIKVTAKDFKTAKSLIEDYLAGRSPLEKDESYQSTRKQLPADTTILVLGDTARVVEMGLDLVKDQLAGIPGFPGGGALPQMKAPKGKPAYFGMAIAFKAEYVTFDLFVPVTAVQQMRKMFAPLIDGDN